MKKKLGRPKIVIDWREVEKLCGLHCTLPEICSFTGYSSDTLRRQVRKKYKIGLRPFIKKHQLMGNISLRRSLFVLAAAGNPSMLIWLSKQHLGMSDKPEELEQLKNQVQEIMSELSDSLPS